MTDLSKKSLFDRADKHEGALIKTQSASINATTAALNLGQSDINDAALGLTVAAKSAVLGIEIETTAGFDVAAAVINGLKIGGTSVLPDGVSHNAAAAAITSFAVMRGFAADAAVTIDVDAGANWDTASQGNVTIKLYTAADAA